jgi:hypothetical protein
MAFVPQYEHDIFVSYAHVDDQPFTSHGIERERPHGWVVTLVRHLKILLGQNFGRPDAVSVWFDSHNLRGHHTLADEIAAKLEKTALFVAMVSPGYIASQWCQDEAELFARAPGDLGRRIFVIEKAPLEQDTVMPPSLAGRRKYVFWYRDQAEQPRTLAIPTPRPDELDYYRKIEDLARDLRSQCRVMSGDTPSVSIASAPVIAAPVATTVPTATASSNSSVLLAEVTDDLDFKREDVRRYLEQHGVPVLPESNYPFGHGEFEAALDVDLVRSRVFVQLLGPMAGKYTRDVPDGYGWLQLECARRRGLPILQWRSPELDLGTIERQRHRELLELETVQATTLESFKSAVLAALAPPRPAPESRRDGTPRPLIFLNTELRHQAIAAEIRHAFGDRAVWTEPLFEGPAEIVREDLEQNLIDCDAMVMVYTDNPGWARAQLRSFHKVSHRRERPVRVIPILDAPPEEKPDLGFYLPEMVVIDGRAGIGPEAMIQLSASLRL